MDFMIGLPLTQALFFSFGNYRCEMNASGKREKEWLRVGRNGIFLV